MHAISTVATRITWSSLLIVATLAISLSGCNSSRFDQYVEVKQDSLPEIVDYNIHIRPILSDRCFNCHGPDGNKRKAGLRLDNAEGAYAALASNGSKHGITPGDLGNSEVFARMVTDDPGLKMPTLESNMSLSPLEIAMIGKWIKQGAVYKPLWSLIPVERPAIPTVKANDKVSNPIDAFIIKAQENAGLAMSGEAQKRTLLNRLSLDLTGLQATKQELDAFEQDTDPKAYEKAVDRLLAKPEYGERMAMDWCDVARYADSHGYQDDGFRNSWHWRDWVIKAFNQNLSFSTFTTWQLAGDLLPNPTPDMMIATGFNRNHQQNQEGGIIPEEYRVEYVLDRTNTVGKAFLGLTVECSRCHDHKYDPISQKEYFSLSAFFNQNDEAGQIPNFGHPGPTHQLVSEQDQAKLDRLKAVIKQLEIAEISSKQKELGSLAKWKEKLLQNPQPIATILKSGLQFHVSYDRIDSAPHIRAEIKDKQGAFVNNINGKKEIFGNRLAIVKGAKGNGITMLKNDAPYFPFLGNFDRFDPFSIGGYFKVDYDKKGGVFLSNAKEIYDGFNGYTGHYNPDSTITFRICNQFPANCIQVTTTSKFPIGQWFHLMYTYDGSSKAEGIQIYVDGNKQPVKIDYNYLTKATDYHVDNIDTIPEGNRKVFERRIRRTKQFLIFGAMRQYQYPALKGALDESRAYSRVLSPFEIAAIAQLDRGQNPTNALPNEPAWWQNLFYQIGAPASAKANGATRLAKYVWDTTWSGLPEVMVMRDRPVLRKTFVLDRGAYDAPTTEVKMGTPAAIGSFPKNLPQNRLGLAHWILSPKNPLTSRVVINRYWQMLMGKGLVRSPGDFGNQGEMPTHPELLDWLASEFMQRNWDLKYMIKLMVMSNTYRQSSIIRPDHLQKDPQNRYWTRAVRYRMPFELIRDKTLDKSGLLVKAIGGPSVFTYQPAGLWEEKTSGRHLAKYRQSHGAGLYRRTMYSFFKRTSAPPTLMTFDGSDRSACFVKREQTNTPLQSLVTLNDIQFQEAARVWAANLIKAYPQAKNAELISQVFSEWTGRNPKTEELASMTRLFAKAEGRFNAAPEQAKEVISVGEWPQTKGLNTVRQASLAVCILTIFNLDEGISRN